MDASTDRVLTINPGSSSLKSAVYRFDGSGQRRLLSVEVARIGSPSSELTVGDDSGETSGRRDDVGDQGVALRVTLDEMERRDALTGLAGIGVRLVHGGPSHFAPTLITTALRNDLAKVMTLDPVHMPSSLQTIDAITERWPQMPKVACFDTGFHRDMPARARMYPLPADVTSRGIRRYGFHGLSYESVMASLAAEDAAAAAGRVVAAHLGSGSSMAAIRDGVSIDTTMGLTPAGGLVMSTRTGDLDPGVLLTLGAQGASWAEVSELVNRRSGLLGVSGISGDMQEIVARAPTDRAAAAAFELYCYTARKFLGAMAAALGGAETVIFTGGIGEHAPGVRAAICEGLKFAGLEIDHELNEQSAPIISSAASNVMVRVIPSNEEMVIARHTIECLRQEG